ncbi:MAG: DUF1513 domain-containing protein [Pontibacterium sp.]
MKRREFLKTCFAFNAAVGATASTPILAELVVPVSAKAALTTDARFYVSAAKQPNGHFVIAQFNGQGEVVSQNTLPSRGHHIAVSPNGRLIAVPARRPGMTLDIYALPHHDNGANTRVGAALEPLKQLLAPEGSHFFGHAIFTHDSQYLITTENQFNPQDPTSGEGRVRIYSVQEGFKQIKDYPAYGIGPHELKLSQDGHTIVVAIGGILTHPNQGRAKLNVDTMKPALVYIDFATGELLEKAELAPELNQLSIRHFDLNHQGDVIFGMQYQGELSDMVPLVGRHKRGQDIELLEAPMPKHVKMTQYCGSVRCDHSGQYAAISHPRGDMVSFWDTQTGEYITDCRVRDGCGIAAGSRAGEFMLSAGTGRTYIYDLMTNKVTRLSSASNLAWDNHMSVVSAS